MNVSIQEYLDEGVVLHSLNCRDYDRLITVFTKNMGVIKCYARGANRKKNPLQIICSPLSHIEMVFTSSKGDLYRLCEGKIFNSYISLRHRWESLNAACEMIQALRKSQFQGKASPLLYSLFCKYLKNIPDAAVPGTLVASFLLKLLRHDGLFAFGKCCSVCSQNFQNGGMYFYRGECFCDQHTPPGAHFFSEEESLFLQLLVYCRNFKEILSLPLTEETIKKIKELFEEMV